MTPSPTPDGEQETETRAATQVAADIVREQGNGSDAEGDPSTDENDDGARDPDDALFEGDQMIAVDDTAALEEGVCE